MGRRVAADGRFSGLALIMTREPLQPVHVDGVAIGWVSSGDPLLAEVLRAGYARELAERARCDAIRRGDVPAVPAERWSISDRH